MSYAEKANQYADLIIEKKMSIREVARITGVSKSTVHTYISKYTTGFWRKLRLKSQLRDNYADRYKKAREATKKRYRD